MHRQERTENPEAPQYTVGRWQLEGPCHLAWLACRAQAVWWHALSRVGETLGGSSAHQIASPWSGKHTQGVCMDIPRQLCGCNHNPNAQFSCRMRLYTQILNGEMPLCPFSRTACHTMVASRCLVSSFLAALEYTTPIFKIFPFKFSMGICMEFFEKCIFVVVDICWYNISTTKCQSREPRCKPLRKLLNNIIARILLI